MPGKVKVRVLGARHLPVMDRGSENTDAFAEVRLGDHPPFKTEVCRKSLNPVWNSEVFRFEVADDLELQDEPLQIRVMDYDTYSANDAVGKVYVDLNPLLLHQSPLVGANPARRTVSGQGGAQTQEDAAAAAGPSSQPQPAAAVTVRQHKPGGAMMAGWLPIYDTMHGIRGEVPKKWRFIGSEFSWLIFIQVNVLVKVELFSDLNKFRQSSCGVPFFCSEYRKEHLKNNRWTSLVFFQAPAFPRASRLRASTASWRSWWSTTTRSTSGSTRSGPRGPPTKPARLCS